MRDNSFSRFLFAVLAGLLIQGCASPRHTTGINEAGPARRTGDDDPQPHYRRTFGAHRGASLHFTENTLDAIRAACNDPKYTFVEFDIQYSADHKIVVFHDQRLVRVFGRMNKVGESTFEELQEASGGQIATYEEVMELTKGKRINIEIKSQGDEEDDRKLVDFIVADIRKRKMEPQVLLSSISADVVKYTKASYPELPAGQIFWIMASTYLPFDFLTEGLYREIQESKADYLMLHVANLRNIEDLLRLKPEGKTIVFWDFDDTMYIVHKDNSDRLWGDSPGTDTPDAMRYGLGLRR